MSDEKKPNRRDFIFTATAAVGAVGAGAAAWPLIDQMNPDASVKALASTEVDVSSLQPGQSVTVLWRGKPVFIKRRTENEIKSFCEVNFNITFPMTSKQKVKGNQAHPFYQWVSGKAGMMGKPRWNFHKYLINPDGELDSWFASTTSPDSKKIRQAIESVLAKQS